MRVLSSHIDSWINTLEELNMLGISLLAHVLQTPSSFGEMNHGSFFLLISKHVFQLTVTFFKPDSFVGPVKQSEFSVTVGVRLVVFICCSFQNHYFWRALSIGQQLWFESGLQSQIYPVWNTADGCRCSASSDAKRNCNLFVWVTQFSPTYRQ